MSNRAFPDKPKLEKAPVPKSVTVPDNVLMDCTIVSVGVGDSDKAITVGCSVVNGIEPPIPILLRLSRDDATGLHTALGDILRSNTETN